MQFLVIAEEAEAFRAWVAQQQPAATPASELAQEGQEIFLGSTCINCHAIEGTGATGELGPDLTHLASRRTLAAGTVPNNRGDWVAGLWRRRVSNPAADAGHRDTGPQLQALLAWRRDKLRRL